MHALQAQGKIGPHAIRKPLKQSGKRPAPILPQLLLRLMYFLGIYHIYLRIYQVFLGIYHIFLGIYHVLYFDDAAPVAKASEAQCGIKYWDGRNEPGLPEVK